MGDRFPFGIATTILGGCTLGLANASVGIASAQSILPAADEIGTIIEQNDRIYRIQGGRRSGNNLFHSFDEFGLNTGEIADFLANGEITNILSRIVGGQPSFIDGLVRVSGSHSHLYLMNPAGIVFGGNASLNVSGDFFATTATGIGLEGVVFSAFGTNDYASLTGTPLTFEFDAIAPAPIINSGNLSVERGQTLALIGGNAINTGILSAPSGNITVAAVPGTSRVKISQAGAILTLEPTLPTSADGTPLPFSVLDLPALLTGANQSPVTSHQSPVMNPGTTYISGKITTRNETGTGGQIAILGDRVTLFDATIDASGYSGGGNIWIGGNYQGMGDLPRAMDTDVNVGSIVRTDAIALGNGGEAIVWADRSTEFYGHISARGGENAGNGGFIEVSGKSALLFAGTADTRAPSGTNGTLLLDPTDVNITLANEASYEGITGNLIVQATNQIKIDSAIALLDLTNADSVTFEANTLIFNAPLKANNLTLRGDNSFFNASISGNGELRLQGFSPGEAISIGNGGSGDTGFEISSSELDNFQAGFSSIVIDGGYNGGEVYFLEGDRLRDPVTITDTSHLIGSDRAQTWTLTGAGSGTIAGSSQNVSFNNVAKITGGSGNDTFVFGTNVNFNGFIDGGAGIDTLNYSANTTTATVDFTTGQATGTMGFASIEGVVYPTLPEETSETNTETNRFAASDIAALQVSAPSFLTLSFFEESGDSLTFTRQEIAQLLDAGNIEGAIAVLDDYHSQNFLSYLGREGDTSATVAEIQKTLQQMSAETGSKTATLYIFARSDQLELILVPPVGDPLRYNLPHVSRTVLAGKIQEFQNAIAHPLHRRNTRYLAPARELYKWLIAPAEPDLQRFDIETITFVLDDGLRTLPMAALHNGSEFLIERYNISLLPSFNLIPARYTDIRNSSIVAMGMSEFEDNEALPAVPVEVEAIAEEFETPDTFLNEAFTLDTLKRESSRQEAQILHLATHGQFQPGTPSESYIQLWDERLNLEQMESLGWGNKSIELLVLSACRTAFGDETAEYGFAGLSVQSGVSSAVASLWYANDAGTLALMTEFYRQLRDRPTKAQALQQAQIALIRGEVRLEKEEREADGKAIGELVSPFGRVTLPPELSNLGDRRFQHPYYWAGLTLIGSPW
ncbi:MAG: CHAT domain-containing protein [Cyanobacteria bacterium P01_E01_bin.42]